MAKITYSSEEEDEILETAHKRYNAGFQHWSEFFQDSHEILRFADGDQWDQQKRALRDQKLLPVLTANLIGTFIRHITGEIRQNTPSIQVDPKDKGASQETAEKFADLIRAIEQQSDASLAYDVAANYAAITGLGFIRIRSEREDWDKFEQRLVIDAIADPETVLIDPLHKKLDGSDAEWCFIIQKLTKEEYNRQFQNSRLSEIIHQSDFSTNNRAGTSSNDWINENEIIIAEYYWKEYTPKTIYKIMDVMTGQIYTSEDKPAKEDLDMGLYVIVDQFNTNKCEVKWCKINDVEILEETTWPGKNIPIVAVKCQELWIEGKRHIKGMVKDAVDPQMNLNYFTSVQAELTALAPRAPWVLTAKQVQGYEDDYQNANSSAIAFLKYNPDGNEPPPQRQSLEVPIQASMAQCTQQKENIKMIFGIQDASLGMPGNEISGTAIVARQQQAHIANYHIYDNLTKAIAQVGNILLEAIPVFYADERDVQIIKRNKESAIISINGPDDKHNLTTGGYGVVVETGPSYATKRQEAVTEMITFAAGLQPQQSALISDMIARNADWPGAKELAQRLALTLPPQIQQAEAATENDIDPKAQLAMAMSQLQQLQQQLQVADQMVQVGHQEVIRLGQENQMLKTKSQVDLTKAENDKTLAEKQMMLDELTTELEYRVKMRELTIQEAELKLEEAKLAIMGVKAAHDISEDVHNATIDHIDRMNPPKVDEEEITSGMDAETLK